MRTVNAYIALTVNAYIALTVNAYIAYCQRIAYAYHFVSLFFQRRLSPPIATDRIESTRAYLKLSASYGYVQSSE